MQNQNKIGFFILGGFICLGLLGMGYLLSDAAIKYKQYERSVTVKGLSQKEFDADIVIWPLQYQVATNDTQALYEKLEKNNMMIEQFLLNNGIAKEEITFANPQIIDRYAQNYSNNKPTYRFNATQTVTVYSNKIAKVNAVKDLLPSLGKKGIIFSGNHYDTRVEYIFTRLNEVKPMMIEEATKNAREVAQKFANDSNSKLGKIKRASQGQFSISQRDNNTPHIKKVRVVSTIEYYLSD